jgi:hypothetical protein
MSYRLIRCEILLSAISSLSHFRQVKVIEGEEHYKKSGKAGVGLFFLEEDSLFVVRNIVEGGSAWRDGTIKLSDICVAVDGISMEERSLQDLRSAVIGPPGTMVALTFHRIIDQCRTVFQVLLRRGLGLVEENARISLELSSALQVISKLEQGGREARASDTQMQLLQQQLDMQIQELLYCRRKQTVDEAQLIRASQTIQSLEEKVQLSSAQHTQLCEKHDALKQRFKLDIETVQKGAALELERCKQEAEAATLHLQAQLQDQKREMELRQQVDQQQQQQLQQQLADSKALAEDLTLRLAVMDRSLRQVEAQFLSQSSTLESSRQSASHLQSHLQVVEKSLGEARASLSSLHTENSRLNAELLLSQEALDASHSRERQLIVQLETSHNNGIAETAARALVAAEQYRLSQVQVESLQKHVLEVQSQLREARRMADAASAAESDALSHLATANSEILKLRQHVRELGDAAKETGDRMRAVQNEADYNRQQLLDLVRLCKQQERAHAALKELLQVIR